MGSYLLASDIKVVATSIGLSSNKLNKP